MSFFKIFSKSKIENQLESRSDNLSAKIARIFTHKKLDDLAIDDLEEILIMSDVGNDSTSEIINHLRAKKFEKNIDIFEVKKFLAEEIARILKPCESQLNFDDAKKPQVIIFNGVNGVGKTTTIGKISANLGSQNKKVLIAACDTFRSAAVEQLEVWAKRAGCEIISPKPDEKDPAAVAYRALNFAKENNFDVLLIDTAGRLQNKQNLMDELKKINVVVRKLDPSAPHQNLLVLDATTGQNAINQLEVFNQIVGITGLIVTKLDGTAKGGILIALAKKFSKPIYAIGIGEQIEDLQEFNADSFSKKLVGIYQI